MDRVWSAEFVVDADLARSLIEAQFPALAPASAALVGIGWDNTAFLVNEALIFRFPRRQIAAPLIEIEARLLPAVAPRLPLPVPRPEFIGRPTDAYPFPFAGHAIVPGRTACGAALDHEARLPFAEPLGAFLAALHAFPAAEAARLGAGHDTIHRIDLGYRLPKARAALETATRSGLIGDARPFAAMLDTAPSDFVPRSDVLVHGDLYVRHLLVDEDHRLAGVIDWGDIHLGDPSVDLAIAYSFLPPAAHAPFRDAYGPVDAGTWQVARLRALWHSLTLLLYGDEVGDADLVREAVVALEFLSQSQG